MPGMPLLAVGTAVGDNLATALCGHRPPGGLLRLPRVWVRPLAVALASGVVDVCDWNGSPFVVKMCASDHVARANSE